MHTTDLSMWQHGHDFCGEFAAAEKNTRRVLALTAVMMVVEIIGGLALHSVCTWARMWQRFSSPWPLTPLPADTPATAAIRSAPAKWLF
jgi:hypothetical protein